MIDETVVVEHDKWKVKHLHLSLDKLAQIWEQFNRSKSMFSDLTQGDAKLFEIVILSPDSFWLEVLDEEDKLVGLIYLTNIQWVIDAEAHLIFFDRRLAEKKILCELVMKWIFQTFPFRRLTATIPAIYFATIRLAKHIGFKEEGRKRESQLIGNKWVDEEILGILRAEVL